MGKKYILLLSLIFEILVGFYIQRLINISGSKSNLLLLLLTIMFFFVSLFSSVFNQLVLSKKEKENIFSLNLISLYISLIYFSINIVLLVFFYNFDLYILSHLIILTLSVYFNLKSFELVDFCRSNSFNNLYSILINGSLIFQLVVIVLFKSWFSLENVNYVISLSYLTKALILFVLMYVYTLKVRRISFIGPAAFFCDCRFFIFGKSISSLEQIIISKYFPDFSTTIYFINFLNSKILFLIERLFFFNSDTTKNISKYNRFIFYFVVLLIFGYFLVSHYSFMPNNYVSSFVPANLLVLENYILLFIAPITLLFFQSIVFYIIPIKLNYNTSISLYNRVSFYKIILLLVGYYFFGIYSMAFTSIIIFFIIYKFGRKYDL